MKKIFSIILFSLFLLAIHVKAQPTASREQLNKHNLSWIKQTNNFDQTGLTIEKIDEKISALIKAEISKNTLNFNLQVPINSEKLKYLGYGNPKETGLISSYITLPNDLSHLNKKLYFYKYDDFIFSTEEDNAVDQKNVYYAIRSVILLKERYPELFAKLFTETKKYLSETPPFKPFSNSNKAFWIAFNSNPNYIASNNTVFLGEGYFPASNGQTGMFSNIAVVNIHAKNILGQSDNIGSKPVYNKSNSWENYDLYMGDGLLVSIAHEMIHNYIDYAYTANDKMFRIKIYRGNPYFMEAEENAVVNTIYRYFTTKGGLLENQSKYYYNTVFDPNIKTLTEKGLINAYGKAFSDLDLTINNQKTVFQIPLFE